jgi:hypothetical protein
MNQTTLLGKLLSPAGFGLVLILFFLPFVAVSCGPTPEQQVTASFTGLAMIVGSAPSYSGPGATPDLVENLNQTFSSQYDNEPFAILAAIVILGGMATALIRGRISRNGAAASLAVLAIGLLVAAEVRSINRLNHIEIEAADGTVTRLAPVYASPRIGFYLAIAILVALGIGHGVLSQRRPAAETHGPPLPGPPLSGPSLPEPDVEHDDAPIWTPADRALLESIEPPTDHAP